MPPKKRSAGKSRATRPTRAKRPRSSDLQEIAPSEIETSRPTRAQPAPPQGLVSIDVSAISTTISAVVSQALQSALSSDNLAAILKPSSVGTDSHSLVEEAVLNKRALLQRTVVHLQVQGAILRKSVILIQNRNRFSLA